MEFVGGIGAMLGWFVKNTYRAFTFPYRAAKAARTTRDRKVTGRLYWIDEPGNAELHRAWLTRSE